MSSGLVISENSLNTINQCKIFSVPPADIKSIDASRLTQHEDGHCTLVTSVSLYGYAGRHEIGQALRSNPAFCGKNAYVVATIAVRAGQIGVGIEHGDRTRFVDELAIPAQAGQTRVILCSPVDEMGALIFRPWSSEPAEVDIFSVSVYTDAHPAYVDAHTRWRPHAIGRVLEDLLPTTGTPVEQTSRLRAAVVAFLRNRGTTGTGSREPFQTLSLAWLLLNPELPLEARFGAVFLRNVLRHLGHDAWSLENCVDSTATRSFATLVSLDIGGQRVVCVQDLTRDALIRTADGRPADYLALIEALGEGRSADFTPLLPVPPDDAAGPNDTDLAMLDRYHILRDPLNLYLFPCVWNNHEQDTGWSRLFIPAKAMAEKAVCLHCLTREGRQDELPRHRSHLFAMLPSWKGEVPEGYFADFNGAVTPYKRDFSLPFAREEKIHVAPDYRPLDEEYFEWCDLAEAVLNAREQFTMFELGAGYGQWLVHGVKMLQSLNPLPFRLLGVEAEPTHFEMMVKHFQNNGISSDDHKLIKSAISGAGGPVKFITGHAQEWFGQAIVDSYYNDLVYTKSVIVEMQSITLGEITKDYDLIDIIDLDIQGAEFEVLASAREELSKKVKRIHIGTHSKEIEKNLRHLFSSMGWDCVHDYELGRKNTTVFGECLFCDGVQSWINPTFRHPHSPFRKLTVAV